MKQVLVIIDDNAPDEDDPIVVRAREQFDEVKIFEFQQDSLNYIKNNIDKYIVVLLDYKFSDDEDTAVQVMTEIRKISDLIPIIIWTAEISQIDDYPELINQHAFAAHSKVETKEVLTSLENAKIKVKNSVLEAIEEYISKFNDEEKDRIKLKSLGGKSFSLRELRDEISHRTEVGLDIEKILIKMTIKNLLNED